MILHVFSVKCCAVSFLPVVVLCESCLKNRYCTAEHLFPQTNRLNNLIKPLFLLFLSGAGPGRAADKLYVDDDEDIGAPLGLDDLHVAICDGFDLRALRVLGPVKRSPSSPHCQ